MKIFLISPAFVSVSENLISFTLPVAESRPESRLISVTESPSPVIVNVSLFCINTIDLSPDEITFETDVTVRRFVFERERSSFFVFHKNNVCIEFS